MAEIQWIKLSVNMFDDEKIKLIRTMPEGESIVMIWVQMLCLAGKINDGGSVYMGQNLAYSDEMLATILNHPLSTMRIALSTLQQFEMIDISNGGLIDIVNWEKHQSTDKMAKIQMQNQERQKRHYYRNALRKLGIDVDSKGFTDDVNELKEIYDRENNNVNLTLANATEVRSKKKEVRSKKLDNNTHDSRANESELKNRFEYIWKEYPNKKGKPKAYTSYKRAIKDGTTDEDIIKGLKNYLKEIEIKGTAKQYIKHGATWFNNRGWEDEYDFAKVVNRQTKTVVVPEWFEQKESEQPKQSSEEVMKSEAELKAQLKEIMESDWSDKNI